jgi:hypothetical protein
MLEVCMVCNLVNVKPFYNNNNNNNNTVPASQRLLLLAIRPATIQYTPRRTGLSPKRPHYTTNRSGVDNAQIGGPEKEYAALHNAIESA